MATLTTLTVNDTGYLRIPQGTTAQRPASPQAGMLRYNTDYSVNEYYNGTAWVSLNGAIANATGGTATGTTGTASIGGSKITTFTSGTGSFTPVYSGSVEVFLVGGGGSGGGLGGGGGAGGVIYQGAFPVTGGVAIPVSVGAGAPYAATTHGPSGITGSNTTFGTLTAFGGGGGAGYGSGGTPFPGGSGGGGPGATVDGQTRWFGNGVKGQGHPGGWGHHGGTGPASQNSPQPGAAVYGGGGGGGAGEKGIPRWSWHADAKGGDGIASSIKGTEVQYFGGGGGGGGHSGGSHSRPGGSTGGFGGGGDARQSGTSNAAHDGRTNSGGGGGGAHHPDTYRSGNGGPGIVVVRYKS
jgi:hypothetical protein